MIDKTEAENAVRDNHKERVKRRAEQLMRVPAIRASVTNRKAKQPSAPFVERKLHA
jgi:hypothetical protein